MFAVLDQSAGYIYYCDTRTEVAQVILMLKLMGSEFKEMGEVPAFQVFGDIKKI